MTVETLDAWIDRQHAHAAREMLRSISPIGIVKARPGFDQVIHPVRGAVIASPIPAAYDPDPDYFFHWYRDSAIVIDALRLLHASGRADSRDEDRGALALFGDFVRFSAALSRLDGRRLAAASGEWRPRVAADFVQFLRPDAELQGIHGEAVAGETRVNPDGTLDISNWARPQNDGPALRALTVLRWLDGFSLDAELQASCARLLHDDLSFTADHWREPCYDIWEEERGRHYFTLRVSAQALDDGAAWLAARGEERQAQGYRTESQAIREKLDGYWLADQGYYRSRMLDSGERSAKELDIAVILAALHAADDSATHSARDPRMLATLGALDSAFETDYPINHGRPAGRGPALGRYRGDRYYSGGAYYFSTLAASELCFRAAGRGGDRDALLARGDRYLETVRAFTPESGDMSEQFDQRTGEQTSAKHLAWSYAAFITCAAARRAAMISCAGLGAAAAPGSPQEGSCPRGAAR
ncbi:MAG TPA: glycoside hydrolase family 15 protein [Steroidobacteraceae bacterium]|nr:glycoside hydrolase family 15 protein [Steroidobacteraceae bacterium]